MKSHPPPTPPPPPHPTHLSNHHTSLPLPLPVPSLPPQEFPFHLPPSPPPSLSLPTSPISTLSHPLTPLSPPILPPLTFPTHNHIKPTHPSHISSLRSPAQLRAGAFAASRGRSQSGGPVPSVSVAVCAPPPAPSHADRQVPVRVEAVLTATIAVGEPTATPATAVIVSPRCKPAADAGPPGTTSHTATPWPIVCGQLGSVAAVPISTPIKPVLPMWTVSERLPPRISLTIALHGVDRDREALAAGGFEVEGRGGRRCPCRSRSACAVDQRTIGVAGLELPVEARSGPSAAPACRPLRRPP